MTSLKPCLWLPPDDAAAAVELYTSVLPEATVLSHHRLENPAGPDYSSDLWELGVGDTRLQILGATESDLSGFTNSLSLSITVDDQAALDRAWQGFLDAGGTESMCGWITDPYGVHWQMVPQVFYDLTGSGDADMTQRVVEAVWQMVKIDADQLVVAARG